MKHFSLAVLGCLAWILAGVLMGLAAISTLSAFGIAPAITAQESDCPDMNCWPTPAPNAEAVRELHRKVDEHRARIERMDGKLDELVDGGGQ